MKNVLLIDDDEDEYFIFSDALRAFNEPMRCIYAQNTSEYLRILQEIRPDIIFIDMNMPMMNGIECIKTIKGMHKKDVPLIVLYSTHIDAKLARDAKIAGADDCLQKTSSVDSLVEKLSPFLDSLK